MVSLSHVALDGTKVQANASKHKAVSHEWMLRADRELQQEINALLRKAQILDAQEDRRYGKGNRGSDLPDDLRLALEAWVCQQSEQAAYGSGLGLLRYRRKPPLHLQKHQPGQAGGDAAGPVTAQQLHDRDRAGANTEATQ